MMLPREALQSMRVMFATPCYGGGAQTNFLNSMALVSGESLKVGLSARFDTPVDSLITNARNTLVSRFLSDPRLTHLFFIDSDVGFEPAAIFRLLLADRDVVAGVYPRKEYLWPPEGLPKAMTQAEFEARYTTYPFGTLPSGRVEVDRDGFGEVATCPAGFLCIRRAVFDRLRAAMPELAYTPNLTEIGELPGTRWLFFNTLQADGGNLSEDFAFCRRWRDIGGKVFIDAESKLSHQGPLTWRGDFKAHLEATRFL